MTRDDIIRMARDAGIIHPEKVDKTLERFAALVAAAEREAVETEYPVKFASVKAFEDWCTSIRANEREACAKVCEEFVMGSPFASAIRARGNK